MKRQQRGRESNPTRVTGIDSRFKSTSEEHRLIESERDTIVNTRARAQYGPQLAMIYGSMCDHSMGKADKLHLFLVVNDRDGPVQLVGSSDTDVASSRMLGMRGGIEREECLVSGEYTTKDSRWPFISLSLLCGAFLAESLRAVAVGEVDAVGNVKHMGGQ